MAAVTGYSPSVTRESSPVTAYMAAVTVYSPSVTSYSCPETGYMSAALLQPYNQLFVS